MKRIPDSIDEITPEILNNLIAPLHPGTVVASVTTIDVKRYGEINVSTSERAFIEVTYNANPTSLPTRQVVKMSADHEGFTCHLHAIYANEVNFYTRLWPELNIETPLCLGGYFDTETNRYILALEDVNSRNAIFKTFLQDLPLSDVQSVLDTLAKLHATYWNSHRFDTDLSWLQTHTEGDLEDLMAGVLRDGIRGELEKEIFKRELLGRIGVTEEELHTQVAAVKQHQSTLPQTVLHGDTHMCNAYLLPDGTGGLFDWQISVRGYVMHDVAYNITTSLPIYRRRAHEKELLAFYLDRLGYYGVSDRPDMEEFWFEYCLAPAWAIYIGWLPCPTTNYGWEINVLAHLRVTAAYEDLDTKRLIAGLS